MEKIIHSKRWRGSISPTALRTTSRATEAPVIKTESNVDFTKKSLLLSYLSAPDSEWP